MAARFVMRMRSGCLPLEAVQVCLRHDVGVAVIAVVQIHIAGDSRD